MNKRRSNKELAAERKQEFTTENQLCTLGFEE